MDYVDGYIFDGARILLGEDGTVATDDGHPVLQYVWGKYWVNNHAHVLRASGVYSLEAIYIALSRASASELITGAVQPKINQKNLRGLLLTMPEPSRLDYLDPVFKSYRVRTEESRRLEKLRDALLPKLMSGEIDVSKVELPMLPNNHLYVKQPHTTQWFHLSDLKGATMESTINSILTRMQPLLNCIQLKSLKEVLTSELTPHIQEEPNLLSLFLTAKEVEGCSPRTITYYESTIQHMATTLSKPFTQIESNDLRRYLADYETTHAAGKVTIDNIRRILSSFFAWLENEDYIIKSPVRRIRRIKTAITTKEVLNDEDLELLRDGCRTPRDLALVDLLASTGMRVGELVRLNRADVNLQERECIVTGKGNKQRPVYFDARAKLHLRAYLATRNDTSPALFVSFDKTANRLSISCVEGRLRSLGQSCGIARVHPHKFRRTLATHAIDKGMPIEQVQRLLGHARIDTTMRYAMVDQSNVKASHRKYLE